MGGHHSKISATSTTEVYTGALQQTTQNCVTAAYGSNIINLNGDNNLAEGISQRIALSVDNQCLQSTTQSADFTTQVANQVVQSLTDKGVALTQWADTSKQTVESTLHTKVSTEISKQTVQNCITSLNGLNSISIRGNGNVVRQAAQDLTLTQLGKCVQADAQTAKVLNAITNSTNQHADVESANPLQPLADVAKSLAQSAMVMAAIVFIVIVAFFFMTGGFGGGGDDDDDDGGDAKGGAGGGCDPGVPF